MSREDISNKICDYNKKIEEVYSYNALILAHYTKLLIGKTYETLDSEIRLLFFECSLDKEFQENHNKILKRLLKEISSFNKRVFGIDEEKTDEDTIDLSISRDNIKKESKILLSLQGDFDNCRIEIYNNSKVIKHFPISENSIHFTPENEGELTIRIIKPDCKSNYIKLNVTNKSENEELELNIVRIDNPNKKNMNTSEEFYANQVTSRSGQICSILKLLLKNLKSLEEKNPEFIPAIESCISNLSSYIERIFFQFYLCRGIKKIQRMGNPNVIYKHFYDKKTFEDTNGYIDKDDALPSEIKRIILEYASLTHTKETFNCKKEEIKSACFAFVRHNLDVLEEELLNYIGKFEKNILDIEINNFRYIKYLLCKKELLDLFYTIGIEYDSFIVQEDIYNLSEKIELLLEVIKGKVLTENNTIDDAEVVSRIINITYARMLYVFEAFVEFNSSYSYEQAMIQFNEDLINLKQDNENEDLIANFKTKWGYESIAHQVPTGGKYFVDNKLDIFAFCEHYKKYYSNCGGKRKYDSNGCLIENLVDEIHSQERYDRYTYGYDPSVGREKNNILRRD